MNRLMPEVSKAAVHEEIRRIRIRIHGAVQGVGFRPFIYRLAAELGLAGWVENNAIGVQIEAEGCAAGLEKFLLRIEREKPAVARIQSLEHWFLDPVNFQEFEIRESQSGGLRQAFILPDIATCGECLAEIQDPANRRYRYPFTNCTHCGPRFSIIEKLPYDRPHTTMKKFAMCEACRAEYENPSDRRFHAQPNACAVCGPQLALWNSAGEVVAQKSAALEAAAEAIQRGKIVAVKGLGGFHLMCDARSHAAVFRLRENKRNSPKPFAVMFPSQEMAADYCHISELEDRILRSPEAPIVLLHKKEVEKGVPAFSPWVSPENPCLGVMLPYTPLHHLLMESLGFPVVATSGNRGEEPIAIDESTVLARLAGLADFYLVHDRPIARHVDDSIVRMIAGQETVLRRARGFAPLPVSVKDTLPEILAFGAHLKNAIAFSRGREIFVSQHIGDLESYETLQTFKKVIEDFTSLYDLHPLATACDLHPDYLSTRFAQLYGLPVMFVQHHLAHVFACAAENEITGPFFGVAWDGTGYGSDGTIWGGEFFRVGRRFFQRLASLRTFPLPGGDQAVREPRRSALGLPYAIGGEEIFDHDEIPMLETFSRQELSNFKVMLRNRLYSPMTSSAGRLFDAVSALLGICHHAGFEGHAPMLLEFSLDGIQTLSRYPVRIIENRGEAVWPDHLYTVDWEPMIRAILEESFCGVSKRVISAKFHNTLASAIVALAERAGEPRVLLGGGCFQNKYLVEKTTALLKAGGFQCYRPQRIPPGDGGIALGQVVGALKSMEGTGDVSGSSGKNHQH